MTKPNCTPEAEFLRKVEVRLLAPEERERFDALLEQEHYLHSARVGGQSLRYVAEVDGQWVALLTFSGAAPHTKAREAQDRVDATPASPAAVLGGQQQPVSGFAGAPTLSQSGLASVGFGSEAAQRRLAGALGPSGGVGGKLRR